MRHGNHPFSGRSDSSDRNVAGALCDHLHRFQAVFGNCELHPGFLENPDGRLSVDFAAFHQQHTGPADGVRKRCVQPRLKKEI